MSYDLLGQLFGKARRRRMEAQARQEAQALLDAGKDRLVSLALQTLNAMPDDSAANELHLIAGALLTQTLASKAVQGLVPAPARPALTAAIGKALADVPASDPLTASPVPPFQIAAKVNVAAAIRALTL